MGSRRALAYLVAGIICAALAAFAASHLLSAAEPKAPQAPTTSVLVATRDIRFGELIVLPGGEGDVNAQFHDWPMGWIPAQAIREPDKMKETKWHARSEIFENQIICAPQIIKAEDFVPEDMYLQRIQADSDDIASGLIRPGQKVDILEIVDNVPKEFMRCAQVYAVGSLDNLGRPHQKQEEEASPNVFLLIKKSQQLDFLKAELAHELKVKLASGTCEKGPALVQESPDENTRITEAEALLSQAAALMQGGEYKEAIQQLNEITARYADIEAVSLSAQRQIDKCQAELAKQLTEEARKAFEEDSQPSKALLLLEQREREYPGIEMSEQALDLRAKAQAALAREERTRQYNQLLAQIRITFQKGDLPAVRPELEKLEELTKIDSKEYNEEELAQPLATAHQEWAKRLKDAEADYRLGRKALESFVNHGEMEKARSKLSQILEQFPEHPGNDELKRKVQQAGERPAQSGSEIDTALPDSP